MRFPSMRLLITLILVLGGILTPPLSIPPASAIEKEVVIGLNIPMTGAYSEQGKDEKRAYLLAIDEVNAQGGVLDHRLVPIITDTKTNAATAEANALSLIENKGAVMISGGVSSAVAVAQSRICQQNDVVFMSAVTHSNATTGHMRSSAGHMVQTAHRNTFRWFLNAWMTGQALVPFLLERFGSEAEYFYITADYTWGHSLEESVSWITEKAGCHTLGSIRTPLGKADFQEALNQAKRAAPDVLVMVLFGNDMVAALKQAHEMGLKEKTHIVVPLVELNMVHAAGPEVMGGVISTTNWYWDLGERFAGTRRFVDLFSTAYGKKPGSAAAAAWVALHQWVDAVRRVGSFSASGVVRALEGHRFSLLKDSEKWRSWDHQAVSSVYIVEGKSPAASKGEWDLLKIIAELGGPEVMRTKEENPVSLETLPGNPRIDARIDG